MDNKPTLDRGFIVPLIIGIFSIFGICLVLLLGRLSALRAVTVVEDTATPFKFLFLGTEPGDTTLTPEGDEATSEATTTPIEFVFDTPTSIVDDFVTEEFTTPTLRITTSPSTPLPTDSGSRAPLNPGTYDQNDPHIEYVGDWSAQTGVTGVFQNTLYVSSTLGNSLTLRFIGEQIRIFYQAGPSLGTIRISMDGLQFDLSQTAATTTSGEWVSPLLLNGTHTVTITHLSGGSINLDSFIIPDPIKTPTPTP